MRIPFACSIVAVLVSGCGGKPAVTQEAQPITSGEIETWAGTSTQGDNGDGKDRRETWLDQPMEMVFAKDGSAIVVDWNNHCVRAVDEGGVFSNVIGETFPGDWPCPDPTNAATCTVPLSGSVDGDSLRLNHPMDVALKDDGSFFLAAWHNHKVESYDPKSKQVTIVAGLMKPGPAVPPPPMTGPTPPGDGSVASTAPLNFPSSLAIQSDGGLLVSDERNNRVRRIAPDTHTITTVAGADPTTGMDADGIPATTALLTLTTAEKLSGSDNPPAGGAIALDGSGNLYVADTFHHCIRRIEAGTDGVVGAGDLTAETISTVAGTRGQSGYSGDGGAATSATLKQPFDVEIGPDEALYVADTMNHVIRRVDLDKGKITTIAGTGVPGFSGDLGKATAAKLREPYGLAFDAAGDLFVVDTLNNRIRRIAH